jgi:sugar phosphate isomerase/epimerase
MDRKIGVVTSSFAHFDIEDAMAGISEARFKYIELATIPGVIDHIIPRPEEMKDKDVSKILNMCEKYKLEVYCVAAHERLMKEDAVNNFKKVIDVADLLNVKYITTGTSEVKTSDDERRFYKDIKILGEYAAAKGVTICLEIHGDWCKNGKIASKIVKKINHSNIKINYDTANVIFYGDMRPEEDIKYAIPYIGFMHIKDKKGGYMVWDFPALGDGEIDFDKIFNLIKDYSGPISVEVEFDGKKHPLDEVNNALKRSYSFLKGYGMVS